MFLVFNKEKICAYIVSILTVFFLFFIASNSTDNTVQTSSNINDCKNINNSNVNNFSNLNSSNIVLKNDSKNLENKTQKNSITTSNKLKKE